MTLPIPLAVRLVTTAADRNIERETRRLWFRKTAPGGNAAARFTLDRSLSHAPDEVAYYGTVRISDARNALPVWDGRLEDPGRSAGGDGEVWELAAVGPAAAARDKARPRIYIDGRLDPWQRGPNTDRSGQTQNGDLASDPETSTIMLVFQEGMVTSSGSNVDIMYRLLYDCGQQIARVRADYVNGIDNATSLHNVIATGTGLGFGSAVAVQDWHTSQTTILAARGSGVVPIPAGDNVVTIRITRYAGGETSPGNRFGEFYNISVRSILKDIAGNDLVTAGGGGSYYVENYVTAAQIVTDMLGRGDLPGFDAVTALVDSSGTAQIDQLAFPNGVYPADVLEALMDFEPAFYWVGWELLGSGKYRFEWRTWPTTIRYEAEVLDGFDAPGSAEGLYNEALIAYQDWRGRDRTKLSTSSVPDLTAAGLTRTYLADLPGEGGSVALATQAGGQALAEHATPPNAGTLTISRPIVDFERGRLVQPWEILPGQLLRVRGVRAHPDSLNATSRDGVTVFKIAAMEYDTDTASARLELDSYSRGVAQALAKLAAKTKRPTRRR